jgi:hypothetical protein
LTASRSVVVVIAASLAALAWAPGIAGAERQGAGQGGPLAIGLVVGEPTGFSGTDFLARDAHAIDVGIGFGSGYYDDHGVRIHADFLWHPSVLASNSTFVMPVYVGIGGLYGSHRNRNHDNHNRLGPRVPVGLDMYFRGAPIDIFFEMALAMNLFGSIDSCDAGDRYCDNRAWLEASLGVRYSF